MYISTFDKGCRGSRQQPLSPYKFVMIVAESSVLDSLIELDCCIYISLLRPVLVKMAIDRVQRFLNSS